MTNQPNLTQFLDLERQAARILEEIQLAVRLLRTLGPVMEQMQELQAVIADVQSRLQSGPLAPGTPPGEPS